MDKKPNAVIVDLDGTLADDSHRLHYVTPKGPQNNWGKYMAGIPNDGVIHTMLDDIKKLHGMGNTIILMSARDESTRKNSEEWLQRHQIPYHHLFLKPKGDNRASPVAKKDMLYKHILPFFNVQAAFDDNEDVIDMFEKEGIKAIKVPGTEPNIKVCKI